MTRGEMLREFVGQLENRPVTWGRDDCCAFPARWIEKCTGVEPPFPTYDTEDEARMLIAQAGGLHSMWSEVAHKIGFLSCPYEPKLGDVGLVFTRACGVVGGVFGTNGVFMWRSEPGVRMLPWRPRAIVAMWDVP